MGMSYEKYLLMSSCFFFKCAQSNTSSTPDNWEKENCCHTILKGTQKIDFLVSAVCELLGKLSEGVSYER